MVIKIRDFQTEIMEVLEDKIPPKKRNKMILNMTNNQIFSLMKLQPNNVGYITKLLQALEKKKLIEIYHSSIAPSTGSPRFIKVLNKRIKK